MPLYSNKEYEDTSKLHLYINDVGGGLSVVSIALIVVGGKEGIRSALALLTSGLSIVLQEVVV